MFPRERGLRARCALMHGRLYDDRAAHGVVLLSRRRLNASLCVR
jgi:hypothetical protein